MDACPASGNLPDPTRPILHVKQNAADSSRRSPYSRHSTTSLPYLHAPPQRSSGPNTSLVWARKACKTDS
ncbi:hypothetical protein SCA6_014382 [Theobroma cacao]